MREAEKRRLKLCLSGRPHNNSTMSQEVISAYRSTRRSSNLVHLGCTRDQSSVGTVCETQQRPERERPSTPVSRQRDIRHGTAKTRPALRSCVFCVHHFGTRMLSRGVPLPLCALICLIYYRVFSSDGLAPRAARRAPPRVCRRTATCRVSRATRRRPGGTGTQSSLQHSARPRRARLAEHPVARVQLQ